MIKYTLEDSNNSSNVFLVDDDYDIKILVAVIFDKAHANIISRKLNEYIKSKPVSKTDENTFVGRSLAKILT
ncbi:hypothetical protein BSK59_15850 [Paenibacillus odorifer]|uniref:hypothetical protein n=1 Tax=Paenibacillus odorifer TaxID=189426 RepID=UPI00096BEAF4|nr:hypothetical protein [Paenibacillus odorifer]OME54054.1 hypothetical protein BSK59_15850 [Paenibacillus odorifer]